MKSNRLGALFIVGTTFLSSLSSSITHSFPKDIPSWQILFIKSFLALIMVLPFLSYPIKSSKKILPIYALRGLAGAIGNWLWILSLIYLPFNQAFLLSLASILFTSLGGWIFHKENFSSQRLWSLCLALGGSTLILKPSFVLFSWAVFLPLGSAALFSVSSLLVKPLSSAACPKHILFYLLLFMSLFSFFPALYSWKSLSLQTIVMCVGLAALYALSQLTLIWAYRVGEASFIAPFKVVRFPFSILISLMYFHEHIPSYTWIGSFFILLSYTVIWYKSGNKSSSQ